MLLARKRWGQRLLELRPHIAVPLPRRAEREKETGEKRGENKIVVRMDAYYD